MKLVIKRFDKSLPLLLHPAVVLVQLESFNPSAPMNIGPEGLKTKMFYPPLVKEGLGEIETRGGSRNISAVK